MSGQYTDVEIPGSDSPPAVNLLPELGFEVADALADALVEAQRRASVGIPHHQGIYYSSHSNGMVAVRELRGGDVDLELGDGLRRDLRVTTGE